MASNLAANLQLGASVTFMVGIAFKAVEDRIKKNTQVLETIFAEVFRLRSQARPTADGSYTGLAELRPYLATTLNLLQQQLDVLRQPHPVRVSMGQAGAPEKVAASERDNLKVFEDLPVFGQAVKVGKALVLPTQISAQFQKITRDIAISAGVANGDKTSEKEKEVIATVSKITEDTGLERNQSATLIKQLYDTGMGLNKALAYAPVAAKFSVGQDVTTDDTARLIGELQTNPKIEGAAELEKALAHIVFQRKGTGEGAADSLSFTQNQDLDKALDSAQPENVKVVLNSDLQSRRATSDRLLSEASDAVDNSLRSLGDAMQPLSDGLAVGITGTAKAFTDLPNAIKLLIAGAAVLGATFLAHKGGAVAKGIFDKGSAVAKGIFNKGRERFIGAPTPEVEGGDSGQRIDPSKMFVLNDPLKVFVVNASDIGCCLGQQGRKRRSSSRGRRKTPQPRSSQNSKSQRKVPPDKKSQSKASPGKEPKYKAPEDKKPKNQAPKDKELQSKTSKGTPPQRPPSSSEHQERSRPVSAPTPTDPLSKPPAPTGLATIAGKLGAAFKEVRGPAVLEAGIKTVVTAVTADTPEEKAEGYGAAAGGLVGSVIGGMVGSVVPVIGTSIGVLVGGMAGDAIGGWIGKRIVASRDKTVPAPLQAGPGQLIAAQLGDVPRSLASAVPTSETPPALAKASPERAQPQQISQQFTFTPNMPITVQGSVTDPMLLAQNLQAMVRRELEELMRMATSRQLSDVPHVYV